MTRDYTDINNVLVDRCRKGDKKAQYELYRAYSKGMYNVCIRIVKHEHEAEDILQEAFVEAFHKIQDFRGESTFGAWLKRIVINRSINYLKKKKLVLFEHIPDAAENESNEDANTDWNVAPVYKAISNLPDGYRIVLSLYLLEGYDHSEIAQILNITESTSKSQYNRAKARIREQFKQGRI